MRGGFRGRGRGRGGGAAEPRAIQMIAGMGKVDYRAATAGTLEYGGMLYPPLDHSQVAFLTFPSELEKSALKHSEEMDNILQEGLPCLTPEHNPTPWRIPETRKVVGIEIETYSDRKRLPQPSSSGTGKLDPAELALDSAFFPPGLWKLHFEGIGPSGKIVSEAELAKKRKRALDDDGDGMGVEKEKDEPEKGDGEESEEGDFDFDDDQSDHQDYDANYFDNGEGDDDEGGEEDEGEGRGGFDD